jgi:hypothetical protein
VHQGRLDPGVRLITKPFTMDQLGSRPRGILDDVQSVNRAACLRNFVAATVRQKVCSLRARVGPIGLSLRKSNSMAGVARLTAPLLPFETKAWKSHGAQGPTATDLISYWQCLTIQANENYLPMRVGFGGGL